MIGTRKNKSPRVKQTWSRKIKYVDVICQVNDNQATIPRTLEVRYRVNDWEGQHTALSRTGK